MRTRGSVGIIVAKHAASGDLVKKVITSATLNEAYKPVDFDGNEEVWSALVKEALMANSGNSSDVLKVRAELALLKREHAVKDMEIVKKLARDLGSLGSDPQVELCDEYARARQAFCDEFDRAREALNVAFNVAERAKHLELLKALSFPAGGDPGMLDTDASYEVVSLIILVAQVASLWKEVGKRYHFLDGCHFKRVTLNKLVLLVWETQDVANRNFPLMINVCTSESSANMALMVEAASLAGLPTNEPSVVYSSDRSKAVGKLARTVVYKALQHFCEEHLLRNVNSSAAVSNESFSRLVEINPGAAAYMDKVERSEWATYTFLQRGVMTHGMGNNNPAECEANRLLPTRKKESVGEVLINFAQQAKQAWDIARGEVSGWKDDGLLIPCAVEEIDKRMKRSREYTIVGDVRGGGGGAVAVTRETKRRLIDGRPISCGQP